MYLNNVQNFSKLPAYINPKALLVKNFPQDFSNQDIKEFLQLFGATDITIIGQKPKCVVAHFKNECDTKNILNFLHQQPINTSILKVEYAKSHLCNAAELVDLRSSEKQQDTTFKLNTFLQKGNGHSFFEQPPPPHLKYQYPKLNRDIMDAICIALETSPKFYTQVLHLMNRMNIEPPFCPKTTNIVLQAPTTQHDVSCQTDLITTAKNAADTSDELESDLDNTVTQIVYAKRKPVSENLPKQMKRFRSLIDYEKNKPQAPATKIKQIENLMPNIFENNELIDRTITIITPDKINQSSISNDNKPKLVPEELPELTLDLTQEEIFANRMSLEQLKTHPMFQNYEPGKRSNKLYIKNLAKSVTETDLQNIYQRYVKNTFAKEIETENYNSITGSPLHVRLMRTGRMKGQAFITFNNPYLSENNYELIEQARFETNGIILKDKIMIVSFGKL